MNENNKSEENKIIEENRMLEKYKKLQENSQVAQPERIQEENTIFGSAECIFAFVVLALGFGFVRFVLWNVTGIFTTVFFWITASVCLVFLKKNNYILSQNHRIQFGLIITFSIIFSIIANSFIKLLAIIFILMLGAYWVYSVCKEHKKIERFFFFAMLKAMFIMPFSSFDKAPKAMSYSTRKSKLSNNIKLVLLGLVITVPVTLVVAQLLISADSGVEKMMNVLFTNFFEDIFETVVQFVIGIPVACYIFGMLCSNVKKENKNVFTDDQCEKKLEKFRVSPNIVMYSAVTPICILYIMFFISQLHYFLSAFNGVLPDGYSYAEYARRGFFELFAIAIINLMLLLAINFISKETGENKPVMLKVYSIMISVFTILMIATALSKMVMYISNYGLTQLRIYVSWFMAILVIVFVLIIIKQLKSRFSFERYAVIAFVLLFGVLCFSNIDGNIAKYNIKMYNAGLIEDLNVKELCNLSDDALVYVLESGIDTQDYLKNTLKRYTDNPYLTYNLSSFKIKRSLEQ